MWKAKRQITLNRKPKEEEKVTTVVDETTDVDNVDTTTDENVDETAGTTVTENENNDVDNADTTNTPVEEEIEARITDKIIGTVWRTVVKQPKWQIKFEAQVAPMPLFKLPADIRQYLINNWFSSDVWKKDKEWLKKHNADMKMINKLKAFLTGK